MPILIKSVTANIEQDIQTNIKQFNSLGVVFGSGDWFRIGVIEVFLQNYKKVVSTEDMNKINNFGLNVNKDKKFKEIQISY